MKRTLGKNDGPQTVLFESDNKNALVFSGTLNKAGGII